MTTTPKPRLRFSRGLWLCFTPGMLCVVGYGYTPAGAFNEWAEVQREIKDAAWGMPD